MNPGRRRFLGRAAAAAGGLIAGVPLGRVTATGPDGAEGATPGDTPPSFFDVARFGARGDGSTDDTRAIAECARALQRAGGGVLRLGPGVFRLFSGSTALPEVLCDFSGLEGVQIDGAGAVLQVARHLEPGATTDIFRFTRCSRVRLSGIRGVALPYDGTLDRGPRLVVLRDGCSQVDVEAEIRWWQSGLTVLEAPAGSDARCTGIAFDLRASDCLYGVNFQMDGDGARGRILGRRNHRSFFVYGVRDHDVAIDSRDQRSGDCLLRGYRGRPLEDVRVRYRNHLSGAAGVGGHVPDCVVLGPADAAPATFRNVRVDLDVRYGEPEGAAGRAFARVKLVDGIPDTADRGHRVAGLQITGSVAGSGAERSVPLDMVGNWGAGEELRDWLIQDLHMTGTRAATLDLAAVRGDALLRGVRSDERLYLRGGDNGRVTLVGCTARRLGWDPADASPMTLIGCEVTGPAHEQPMRNKRFIQSTVDGRPV